MVFQKSPAYVEDILCCHCGLAVSPKERDTASYRNHEWCGPCNHEKCSSCGLRIGTHHVLIPNKLVEVEIEYHRLMEHKGKINKQKKQGILKLCKLCYMASQKRPLRLHGKLRA
jgi:hypothetical protein